MAFSLQSFNEGFQDTILKTAMGAVTPMGGGSQVTPPTAGQATLGLPKAPNISGGSTSPMIPKAPQPPANNMAPPATLPKMTNQPTLGSVGGRQPINPSPAPGPLPPPPPDWAHRPVTPSITQMWNNATSGVQHAWNTTAGAYNHMMGRNQAGTPEQADMGARAAAPSDIDFQLAKTLQNDRPNLISEQMAQRGHDELGLSANPNATTEAGEAFRRQQGYEDINTNLGPNSAIQRALGTKADSVFDKGYGVAEGAGMDISQQTGITSKDKPGILQEIQQDPEKGRKILEYSAKTQQDPNAYAGNVQAKGAVMKFVKENGAEILAAMGGLQGLHYLSQIAQNMGNQGANGAVQGADAGVGNALPVKAPFAFKTDNEADMDQV